MNTRQININELICSLDMYNGIGGAQFATIPYADRLTKTEIETSGGIVDEICE